MKSNTFTPVGASALGKCQVSGVSHGHMGPRQETERKRTAGVAQAGQSRSIIQRNMKKCGPSWEFSGFLKMLMNHSRKKRKTIQGKVCKLPR